MCGRDRWWVWLGLASVMAIAGVRLVARQRTPTPVAPPGSGAAAGAEAPVLLLTNDRAEHPFGAYLAEIFRAEGVNAIRSAPLDTVEDSDLAAADIVVLSPGPVSRATATRLDRYISRGGRLVTMQPDATLLAVVGLEATAGTSVDGSVVVNVAHAAARGIAPEPLRYRGTAVHYRPLAAEVVAWLAGDGAPRNEFPAVTLAHHGDGFAVAWAFDLARSVAYTRQGNPAWANQERDGLPGLRATDLFAGAMDLDRLAVAQADELQRLLANLVDELSRGRRPVPRLWYFPAGAPAVLIATADAHGSPAAAVDEVLARVERDGGHASVYYLPPPVSRWRLALRQVRSWAAAVPLVGRYAINAAAPPLPAAVQRWRARGHEFSLHPVADHGAEAGYRAAAADFARLGYGPPGPTVRTHEIRWSGWVEPARAQAAFGARMNLDYYLVGPAFRRADGEWVYGHFTGSGLPMKFVDESGRVLDIYQQATELVDEHLIDVPWTGQVRLAAPAAVAVARTLLARSVHGPPAAIAAQFHVDPFAAGGRFAADAGAFLDGTLAAARALAMPIVSAAEWLRFTEVRHDLRFEAITWMPATGRLELVVRTASAPDVVASLLLPRYHDGATLARVAVDGTDAAVGDRTVGGVDYAAVPLVALPHRIIADYR